MWYHWLIILWLWLGSSSLTLVYVYLEESRRDPSVFEAHMRRPAVWAYCLLVPLFAPLLYPIAYLADWVPAIDKWLEKAGGNGK
jgi:hypothetical protein